MQTVTNLPVNMPNGSKCTVSGEIEYLPQQGYQLTKLTHKDGKKYFDSQILKSYVSNVMIENHLKQVNVKKHNKK